MHRDGGKRNPDIIGQLVHPDPVAFYDGGFHRSGRNCIPICKAAAKYQHQKDKQNKAPVLLEKRQKGFHRRLQLLFVSSEYRTDRSRQSTLPDLDLLQTAFSSTCLFVL